MEGLFQFLGSYWWLIFPLMGVMGAVGSAWERGARRRHKRRLEVLHAKAELKAAQAAARATAAPTGSIPVPAPGAAGAAAVTPARAGTENAGTQLQRLFESHDAVTARWLEYELDVGKLIAFPAMSDGRQPLTAAFLRAKREADSLRPASVKARITKDALADYRRAVNDYEVAFDVAERDARRIRDSSFTELERRRLDTAKQLLTVAIDQAATPAERQLAYRRVREELDGLISLSDGAIEVLEAKVALELTTGSVTTQDAAPEAPAAQASPMATAPRPETSAPRQPEPWPVPARGASTAPGRIIHPKH